MGDIFVEEDFKEKEEIGMEGLFSCLIILSSLSLNGGGLTVFHSLFLSWPIPISLLLHRWLCLVADTGIGCSVGL